MKSQVNLKDYAAIEGYIRAARLERSVLVAEMLANAIQASTGYFKRFATTLASGLDAERDRRAVEADAFLKRSVPRYW